VALIPDLPSPALIVETEGQLAIEWAHLKVKLALRKADRLATCQCQGLLLAEPHPLFTIQPGASRDWDKAKPPERA